MKKLFSLLLSLALLLSLSACARKQYADDKAGATLVEEALRDLHDGVTYLSADADYLDDYFTLPDYVKDTALRHASDAGNLNEVGVFHLPPERVGEMKALLEGYLSDALESNQAWYDSYIPEETPKLRDAEVRSFGNYVAYAILDAKDRKAFFDSVEQSLVK